MSQGTDDGQRAELPEAPIDRLVGPLARFLHVQAASGIVLLFFTVAALALANSSVADGFAGIWKTSLGFELGEVELRHSVKHWINDGLMAVFFFVIYLVLQSGEPAEAGWGIPMATGSRA